MMHQVNQLFSLILGMPFRERCNGGGGVPSQVTGKRLVRVYVPVLGRSRSIYLKQYLKWHQGTSIECANFWSLDF